MTQTQQLTGIVLAQACASLLADKKAENLRILNIAGFNSYTDHLVICSGNGRRHALAMAHYMLRELKCRGQRPVGVEGDTGIEEDSWILLDYGNSIVHIFTPPARAYYDIEGLWPGAPQIKLPEAVQQTTSPAVQTGA